LTAGEEASVPLAGGGSAGYTWSWTVEGDAEAVELSLEAGPPSAARKAVPLDEPFGGSLNQLLVIKALRPGRALIHLGLGRSFGPPRPPRLAYDVAVYIPAS